MPNETHMKLPLRLALAKPNSEVLVVLLLMLLPEISFFSQSYYMKSVFFAYSYLKSVVLPFQTDDTK